MRRKIILGSASPRRRELLSQIGVEFTVKASEKEEVYHSSTPEEIVKELALMKAENVVQELMEEKRNITVIGADTVVVLDEKILGKPRDEEDAVRMLKLLRGRGHDVYTGVAVIDYDGAGVRRVENQAVRTTVYVHGMSEEEIRAYTGTGEPADKAGAYGIQGAFAKYIDRIDGDYYNVVGLPVSVVYQTLKTMEVL